MLKNLLAAICCCAAFSFPSAVRAAESEAQKIVGDEAKWGALRAGDVCLLSDLSNSEKSSDRFVLAGIIIDAPVKVVWDVVNDKEAAVEYVSNLKHAKVLENKGNVSMVEQKMKMSVLLPTFTYVVKHTRTPHSRVDFKRASGDLKDIEGYWRFVSLDEGKKTLLVYRLHVDPGILIPQGIIRGSLKKSLPEVLINLRDRVQSLSTQ